MRKLVIVGGGSAGWITASYLNGALNFGGKDKCVDISVIESPEMPRITVGEATIPNIIKTLGVIGIDETEFMKATDATFKQSIRFVNWEHNDRSSYHHPFSIIRGEPIDGWGELWLNSRRDIPYGETVSDQPRICDMNLAPQMLGEWRNFGPPLKYAYHMDAQKFADYLTAFSTARGVTHIKGHMVDVHTKENGFIESVELKDGRHIEGDLFIDCTGFRSLLLGKVMDVPYRDFSQYLLCNRACVAQFPYEDLYPGFVRPYTTATALSNGWVWDIPMQSRRSVGYVFSSAFLDDDRAQEELATYQGIDPEGITPRFIDFRVGQRTKAWEKNCIAVGLSGGFIEPLESTGLYLCDEAATILAEYFPYRDEDIPALSYRFNRLISNRYFEILDFINLHYCLTKRNDTDFWKEVQKLERINDRLKAKLEFWNIKEPSGLDFADQSFAGFDGRVLTTDGTTPVDTGRLWQYESYKMLLYGMHNDGFDPGHGPITARPPTELLPFVRQRVQHADRVLPDHARWLQERLGMKHWEAGAVPAGWR